jgi:hypothetical protein
MIEELAEMHAGTIAFRIAGEVEREDNHDVLVPEIRRALDAGGGGLRTLYLIEDLDEIEPGALGADAKLGFDLGLRHHGAWVRLGDCHRPGLDGPGNAAVRADDPGRSARIRERRARVGEGVGGR